MNNTTVSDRISAAFEDAAAQLASLLQARKRPRNAVETDAVRGAVDAQSAPKDEGPRRAAHDIQVMQKSLKKKDRGSR